MAIKDKEKERTDAEKLKDYKSSWYKKNKERITAIKKSKSKEIKAYMAAYREANAEKIRAHRAEYSKANPKKISARNAAWRARNPEHDKERQAAWRIAHPEKRRKNEHNRRARIHGNGGKLSDGIEEKLFFRQNGKCAICRTSLKKTGYHLDHIIPISKGGVNDDRNVQLACPKCNIGKKDKDPLVFMRSKGYLL